MANSLHDVLHIDDDASFTTLIAAQLLPRGFRVRGLNDSRLALAQIAERQYPVVILDLDLPHIGGLELLAKIKAYDSSVRVLVLSGATSQKTVFEAVRAGAEAVLFKPLESIAALATALNSAFAQVDRWWETLEQISRSRRQLIGAISVK